ncbi:sensor histidine kinase [Clostridium akagii]|uniref:sensor histidine kinase n=1 Tax=Clostridium akagii TaxID=91623 RepID=UPI000A9C2489|nr:HAMP domain-containing sensor histidine kinase [Clostridium akagii]
MNIEAQARQKNIEEDIKKSIANISHDLRTPLTSVIGYIQMIKKNDLTKDEQDRYLDIALNRSKSLHRLLNDFFELSVIESPEYKLQNEIVDINNVLCEMLTSFYEDFTSKGIVPEINMPDKNVAVMANDEAIRRVIENLIVNMIKYSEGKANINLEANGDDVVLYTSNAALNIREEDVNSIFDRFYNGDISRTNSNSTGLGLTIVKSLMEKMGGKIHAELKQGKLYIYCKWKIYRLPK